MSSTLTTGRRLSSAEAEALWRRWRDGRDSHARDRLVLAYAPMVRYLAARKARELPSHCELEDLASCGLVALIEAVDRFDPTKGATFEQYAWTRVAGAIVDELRRRDWASRSVRRFGRRVERARDEWIAKHGSLPTDAELFRSAIASLSERERKVLTFVHVHELPGAEVGRILGVSESRVSQILTGIRRKLKDEVEAYDSAFGRVTA